MSQHQETELHQLVDIIQALQSGRATGLLMVQRGIDTTLEEGTIVFVNGQVEEAKAEGRTGIKALTWLSTWSQCLFKFVPANSKGSTLLPPSPTPSKLLPDTNPSLSASVSPFKQQETFSGEEKVTEKMKLPHLPISPPPFPYRTMLLDAALQEIEQEGFSRSHRLLLFWLDGRRPKTELARLVRCSQSELYEMLVDLERVGVIRIP